MKRFFLLSMVICAAVLAGCNKEKTKDDSNGELVDGAIVINTNPDVNITDKDAIQETNETDYSVAGIRSTDYSDLTANDYRFKLVKEVSTLKIGGKEVQATHVKIVDNYAFVSYNFRGDPHIGGVVVYEFTVHEGTLENVKVDVKSSYAIEMAKAQINALDYYNGKLYMAGASSEPKFGYVEEDGFNYAFFMVLELNTDKSVNEKAPIKIEKLTSFQATSIRANNNRIFITTGDGTGGTKGGLYIYNATDYSKMAFIEADHARSADIDASNVYVMQAEGARVTKYDFDGNPVAGWSYDEPEESLQEWAKSEILAWDDYLFVSENESGLRMLRKNDARINSMLDRPGADKQKEVTNSVCMNSDIKKTSDGTPVQSNLLLLANGEKGVYWYDVAKDASGTSRIVAAERNSILGGPGLSANFIESRGNIVFVADGLGGLKILYIGEDENTHWDCTGADVFGYGTWMKDNGGGTDLMKRKVGDVFFAAEAGNLAIYIYSTALPDDFIFELMDDEGNTVDYIPNRKTISLRNAGVAFGTSLKDFDDQNLLSGGPSLEQKNITNGAMKDKNAEFRTIIPGGVKFTFPKSYFEENFENKFDTDGYLTLMCIVYSGNGAWAYGNPQGPSGATGTGVNNNGQILNLSGVGFCKPVQ